MRSARSRAPGVLHLAIGHIDFMADAGTANRASCDPAVATQPLAIGREGSVLDGRFVAFLRRLEHAYRWE